MDGNTWFLTISTAIGGFIGYLVGWWKLSALCDAVPDNCVYALGDREITGPWGRWNSDLINTNMELGLFIGFFIGVWIVAINKYTRIQISVESK